MEIAARDSRLASVFPQRSHGNFPQHCNQPPSSYRRAMKCLAPLLAICLVAVSCVPSTPQARIAENPTMFEHQPAKHRSLIEQGELARGMSKNAVYLAWGSPSGRYEGSRDGKTSERWDYNGSRPVYTTSFYGGLGYGGYRHGRGPYYGGMGFGPEITYIPYRSASVSFINSRVESWERMR
jgi:hypothetical protein